MMVIMMRLWAWKKKKENRGEKKEERRNAYVPAGEREKKKRRRREEKERKGPVYGLGSITTKTIIRIHLYVYKINCCAYPF